MTLLKAENLSVGYEGRVVAAGLTFTVEEGDWFCIVGNNGSGKSTLVKTILGLRKPISGSVVFHGGDGKKRVGYLSQQSADAYKEFPASVEEIVRSGCLTVGKWSPFYTREQKVRAMEAMKTLGLEELRRHAFGELSGGQKQRVLLARALCAAERCIVLDEPVSGLDPVVTEDMYDALEQLNREGMTVLMVSHDVKTAVRYASKVLHIDEKESFFGTKEEYCRSEIGQAYMEKAGK